MIMLLKAALKAGWRTYQYYCCQWLPNNEWL